MTFSGIEIEQRCCHEDLCISTVPHLRWQVVHCSFACIGSVEFNGEARRIWMDFKIGRFLCKQTI